MTTLALYLKSSIGRKFLMGLTGLGLSGFVLMHMTGNLLIIKSAEAYNKYGHALVSNPLIYIAEAALLLMFLYHALCGLRLAFENRKARPSRYAVCSTGGDKAATLSSKTMAYSGSLILIFVILHVATFKYGTYYSVNYGGVEMRDLHRLIVEVFHDLRYVAWYFLCLIFLGFHLSHGFASSFQSMGFNHPSYQPWIQRLGYLYALIVAAGFISQPIYVYFFIK